MAIEPLAYPPGWRSSQEKKYVYAQFDEAWQIYQRRASEDRK